MKKSCFISIIFISLHVKRNSFSLIDIFSVNYILAQIGR